MPWLTENANTITAIATVAYAVITIAGVLVAWKYAHLTRDLWRATRDQADTTRRMFEASHRPYLAVEAGASDRAPGAQLLLFLRNHGSVPAWVSGASIEGVQVAEADAQPESLGTSIRKQQFPLVVMPGERVLLSGLDAPHGVSRGIRQVSVAVSYSGVTDQQHRTAANIASYAPFLTAEVITEEAS